jgi:hypothetical protein
MNTTARLYMAMLVMLALASGMPILATGTAAQAPDPSLGIYQGPAWGHLLRWEPGTWQVAASSSEGGVDVLELRNDTTLVRLAAFEAFGGDPDQCLTDAAASIQAQSPQAFAQGRYDDGTLAEEHGDGYAYGAFLSGPGPDQVIQVECRTLMQGRAVLQLMSVIGGADYDAGAPDGMSLMNNVALPRGAFVTRPEGTDQADTQHSYRVLDTGAGLSLDVIAHDDAYADPALPALEPGTRWVAVDVMIENSGEMPIDIDAATITARDDRGTGYAPASWAWTQATGDPSVAVQAIAPDQAVAATLVYQVPSDAQVTSIACTCGSDPAVPVEIGNVAPDPRDVFPPPPYLPCSPYNWERPKIVVDPAGAERVTMTATWLVDREGIQLAIGVENSGAAPLTIAPEDLWIVADDHALSGTATLTWVIGDGGSATGPRELAAGERAVAVVAFTLDQRPFSGVQLYYVGPEAGQLQDVAWFCAGCGCGGGGRPKVVVGF